MFSTNLDIFQTTLNNFLEILARNRNANLTTLTFINRKGLKSYWDNMQMLRANYYI